MTVFLKQAFLKQAFIKATLLSKDWRGVLQDMYRNGLYNSIIL